MDMLHNLNVLKPDEIVFFVSKARHDVNLYEELNKVRDLLKIDESKIKLFIA